MRVSKVTLALLGRVRGSVEATDDETVYYLAAREIIRVDGAASVAAKHRSEPISDSGRIQRAPTRPVNAQDAEMRSLPSERPGS
jgi:hypothetical protein